MEKSALQQEVPSLFVGKVKNKFKELIIKAVMDGKAPKVQKAI